MRKNRLCLLITDLIIIPIVIIVIVILVLYLSKEVINSVRKYLVS